MKVNYFQIEIKKVGGGNNQAEMKELYQKNVPIISKARKAHNESLVFLKHFYEISSNVRKFFYFSL